jgi:hypothetical protein
MQYVDRFLPHAATDLIQYFTLLKQQMLWTPAYVDHCMVGRADISSSPASVSMKLKQVNALQVAQHKTIQSELPHLHEGDLSWYKPFPGTAHYRGDRTKLVPKFWSRFDLPLMMPSAVAQYHAASGKHALGLRMAVRYGKTAQRW